MVTAPRNFPNEPIKDICSWKHHFRIYFREICAHKKNTKIKEVIVILSNEYCNKVSEFSMRSIYGVKVTML